MIYFPCIEFWINMLFFSTLKIIYNNNYYILLFNYYYYYICVCKVLSKKSDIIFSFSFLYNVSFIFQTAFKVLSYFSAIQYNTSLFLNVLFFKLSKLFASMIWCCLLILKNSWPLSFWMFHLPYSLFLLWYIITCTYIYCRLFGIVPQLLNTPFVFFFLFVFFSLDNFY